jgi:S1-C subfamily serine protease
LHNLIQISADVVAGDSGGPLYDSDGQIIGMDTAASSGNGGTSSGYAITIADAKSIANQIEKGVETSRIRIGNPGLLGVTATGAGGGATVDQVLSGGAADTAGISVGDVITRFDGKTISSADDLHEAAGRTDAGQRVRVTWTDSFGSTHTATLTLGTGPAD